VTCLRRESDSCSSVGWKVGFVQTNHSLQRRGERKKIKNVTDSISYLAYSSKLSGTAYLSQTRQTIQFNQLCALSRSFNPASSLVWITIPSDGFGEPTNPCFAIPHGSYFVAWPSSVVTYYSVEAIPYRDKNEWMKESWLWEWSQFVRSPWHPYPPSKVPGRMLLPRLGLSQILSPLIQSSLLPLPTLVLPKPRAAHGGSAPAPDSSMPLFQWERQLAPRSSTLLIRIRGADRIFHWRIRR